MDTHDDTVASAESTLLTNAAQIEATVVQLCEMGFPRDDVVKALRAAFNNPNRAVEYLMSGHIPDVGPATAKSIISWREENGRFTAIDDLLSVSGIGDKTFADLKGLVTL